MQNQEIDKFLDAYVEAICIIDFCTFTETISWYSYDPLISKFWTKRILKMIDDCKRAKLSSKRIAGLFPNMSQLRNMILFDLWMAKYAGVSESERVKIFNFYNSLLKSYCLEDPYAASKNIIHTKKEISEFLKEVKPATPEIAKKLGKLVNACYHLGHAMYSDMNCSLVYENYGPYDASEKYGNGYIAAIKEFGNLRTKELWSESLKLPCDFIQIVCIYKDAKMTVDAVSHAIYKGDLIRGLKYFILKLDNKNFSIEKVDKVSEDIGGVAVSVFQKFQSLDFEAKKEKYYFTKAYVYKRIYDKLRQDWHPSKEILAEMRGKKLYGIDWPENKEKQKKLVRKILDPRIDFNPRIDFKI